MRFIYAISILVSYSFAQAQVYTPVDAKSKVSFAIKNFGSTVNGTFKGLKGNITFDAANLTTAQFDVSINAATIDSGIGIRDNHLRKTDYFGVIDFPAIRFVSTKVDKSGKINEATVTGKLTIKKTTKEITFPFRYSQTNDVLQFLGEFKINRRDFSVGANSFSLADELIVFLDVKASK
jgi:polyisoprenoid-binding protein YceI